MIIVEPHQYVFEEASLEEILNDADARPIQWLPGTEVFDTYFNEIHSGDERNSFPFFKQLERDLIALNLAAKNSKGRYVESGEDSSEEKMMKGIIYLHKFHALLAQGKPIDPKDTVKLYKWVIKQLNNPNIDETTQVTLDAGIVNKFELYTPDVGAEPIKMPVNVDVLADIFELDRIARMPEQELIDAPIAPALLLASETPIAQEEPKASGIMYALPPSRSQRAEQRPMAAKLDYEALTHEIKNRKEAAAASGDTDETVNVIEAHLLKMMADYDAKAFDFTTEPKDALDQLMREGYLNQTFDWDKISKAANELHVEEKPATIAQEVVVAEEELPQESDFNLVVSQPAAELHLPSLHELMKRANGQHPVIDLGIHLKDIPQTNKAEVILYNNTPEDDSALVEYEEVVEPAPKMAVATIQREPIKQRRGSPLKKAAVVLGLFVASLMPMKFGENKKEVTKLAQDIPTLAVNTVKADQTVSPVKKSTKKKTSHRKVAPTVVVAYADTAQNISYAPTAEDYMSADQSVDTLPTEVGISKPQRILANLQTIKINTDLHSMITDSIKIVAPVNLRAPMLEIKEVSHDIQLNLPKIKKPGLLKRIFGKRSQDLQPAIY